MRLLAAMIILFGTAFSAFAAMSGNEIRSELIGKNLSWKNGKYSGTASYASNGSAKVSIKGADNDTGRWTLKGNQLCITWKRTRGGKEGCFTVNKTGSKTYKYSNGSVVTVR